MLLPHTCDGVDELIVCPPVCPIQLSRGLQNKIQSGDQEAVPALPVGALRQAGLQGAEAPQTHEA